MTYFIKNIEKIDAEKFAYIADFFTLSHNALKIAHARNITK
jgi:hypothetical protein